MQSEIYQDKMISSRLLQRSITSSRLQKHLRITTAADVQKAYINYQKKKQQVLISKMSLALFK